MNLKIFCVPLSSSIKIEQAFKQVYEQVEGVLRNVCCNNLDLTQGLYRIMPVHVLRNTFKETVAWVDMLR